MNTEHPESIFTADSYVSPPSPRKPLHHYLMLGSRWSFYLTFITEIILPYSKEARQGIYDDTRWWQSSQHVLRMLERFGARVHIEGMNNLRSQPGPFVFIGNHMSTLETLILPGIIQPLMPLTFVVKESLTKGNFFGPVMRSRDPIAVGRVNPREDLEKVLTQGTSKLASGQSIVIFPQSTRTPGFDPDKFNTLGIKLALKAGVPVIPVALKTDFWGDSKIIRGFGPIRHREPVRFAFGEPIKPEGRGKKEHEAVVAFIQSKLAQWSAG